ncbi:MAG: replicative DNA helicase [Proteobacteria bacterium]|nr:replicative DNA helicase [Desulfobulbaceae bacterium]MBU4152152.1 replicative DNA helicase [Pseudomonadota bacterium]
MQEVRRIPPHNREAEVEILGSCLVYQDVADKVVDILSVRDFYHNPHRLIFRTIVDLRERNQPVDIITVHSLLRDQGRVDEVGGAGYVASLTDGLPSRGMATHYAELVKRKAELRAIIDGATRIADRCYTESFDGKDETTLADLEVMVREIIQKGNNVGSTVHISIAMKKALERLEAASGGGALGIPTGFKDLDRMLSGLEPSDLIIISGRPSMGKTAIAMNIAEHQAIRLGLPVGVISLEMSADQLAARMVCGISGVDSHKVRSGRLNSDDWHRIRQSAGKIEQAPIYVDDLPGQKASVIRRKARRMKDEHGIAVLFVDYLQLAHGEGKNTIREAEIREISGEMKAIAKELSIPVVCLSQLSRECEKRLDKRPMISDLRDSGAIEQDADVILFVYRDEVYNKSKNNKNRGTAEIIIGKQRKGPTGTIVLQWDEKRTRFHDMIRMHEPVE